MILIQKPLSPWAFYEKVRALAFEFWQKQEKERSLSNWCDARTQLGVGASDQDVRNLAHDLWRVRQDTQSRADWSAAQILVSAQYFPASGF